MEGTREDEQINNGGEEKGLREVGDPLDGESPHLGGPVTCGSGESTPADERRDGHGRCIVGAGAASSWTLSRKLSLYWLAGARLEAGGGRVSKDRDERKGREWD
jgi:hypothetical protein